MNVLARHRRWFGACVSAGDRPDDPLVELAQSVFLRVDRALQARDTALRALNRPQDNDAAEDVLANLDAVLLGLMAALDVTARVTHHVLNIDGSPRAAGWQRDRWLQRVKHHTPALAELVAADAPGGRTLFVLRELRNSIHEAAMDQLAVLKSTRRREETLVGLPRSAADELLGAMDALGGRTTWGVRELVPGRVHADPGMLLNRLLAGSVNLINQIMLLTPVERLSADVHKHAVPGSPDDEVFSARNQQSIRWQLGL